MIKAFFLSNGMAIVADEEMVNGKRLWKTPCSLEYEGKKIQMKSLFHYTKGNEFYPRNPDILIEDEVTLGLANQYRVAVERFIAGKSGLVIPDLVEPEQKRLVSQ